MCYVSVWRGGVVGWAPQRPEIHPAGRAPCTGFSMNRSGGSSVGDNNITRGNEQ